MATFHHAHTTSTILVIESDALMLTAIGGVLDMQGHNTILARTEQVATQALRSQSVDLIILSIQELDAGCAFAGRLRADQATVDIPVIFIVPEMAELWAASLQEHGGVYCVHNSVDPNQLIELVGKALWMPHLAQRKTNPPATHLSKSQDWIKLG